MLGLLHLKASVAVVGNQRIGDVVRVREDAIGECDGVFHRQLGAGADGEMRGMGGVAQDHHVLMHPAFALDARELAPDGAVGQQPVPLKLCREQFLQIAGRAFLIILAQAGICECLGRCLDDPGRCLAAKAVGVDHPVAVRILLEMKGEGLQRCGGTHPAELVALHLDGWAECGFPFAADNGIGPVGTDQQVTVSQFPEIGNLVLELDLHPQGFRALLQDVQQLDPADAAEPVTGGADDLPPVVGVDLFPIGEAFDDLAIAFRV